MRIGNRRITITSLLILCGFWAQTRAVSAAFGEDIVARDPFIPLVDSSGRILIPQEVDIAGLALRGIIYAGTDSLAVINDQVLKVGDFLGEYTVVQIEHKEVQLEKHGSSERYVLKLEEE